MNFGLLAAEIGSLVWGTTENFNRPRVLASLLQRRRSTDVNQTLHDVWPSPALVYYVYIWGGGLLSPNGILPAAKFTLCPTSKSCVLLCWQSYCTALEQWALAKVCGVVQGMELRNFCRRRHLHSAGRPSRWASAHVLVTYLL